LKEPITKKAGGVAQGVALSSNPSSAKKKKKERKDEYGKFEGKEIRNLGKLE
jgi:hypothetical protein